MLEAAAASPSAAVLTVAPGSRPSSHFIASRALQQRLSSSRELHSCPTPSGWDADAIVGGLVVGVATCSALVYRKALRARRNRVAASADGGQDVMAQRRKVLLAPLAASSVAAGTCSRAAAETSESDYAYSSWPLLPLAPYGRRRTQLREVVPGEVWTLDQIFGTFYVYVPIRATVLKVDGGLLVYAPVSLTPECTRLLDGLVKAHGPVRWIVLPSKAVEHKVPTGGFAKHFPDAKLFVIPGQFSVPVDVPLSLIGFPSYEIIDANKLDALPWAADCESALLNLPTFGELALFHRRSKTLVLTDTLVSIPKDPPELLVQDEQYRKALLYHARDDGAALEDSEEARRRGWERISLFATFFNPGALLNGEVAVPETGGKRPWKWQPGWERSFLRLRDEGRPFVAPIIRELILKQQARLRALRRLVGAAHAGGAAGGLLLPERGRTAVEILL
eukprot:TRINITY_DN23485_c0_g1_i1.p1 TRINITY_DN23485_c0_g1~~TRINITY_DN23485_c0_g1_i1.p1  ORF type:complete len:449 (-),score=73.05 TRINITY_DN23485_c0_g1_i1:674-2020(-)